MMLDENKVIETMIEYLQANGYDINGQCSTSQSGIDIEAQHRETKEKYFIEAKGATSSKSSSALYGQPFNKNQIKVHIGVALVQVFTLYERFHKMNAKIGIALPDNENHRKIISSMRTQVINSKIDIFFVSENNVELYR